MNSLYKSFCFCLVLLSLSINGHSQFEGKVYITSECASGGFDYYFFNENVVISVYDGGEYQPYIQYGEYILKNGDVEIKMYEEWYGKGVGDVIYVSSIDHYERYVARWGQSTEKVVIKKEWLDNNFSGSCENIGNHDIKTSDPHQFLRNKLIGKYPETYQRLLTNKDLQNKSKTELRYMRNEIYARYGYIFKSKDLKKYFENQKGYSKFSSDVEAFLSETEKNNVRIIQEFERK